jgi:hypothetical protein
MREVVNGLMYILSTGCQWRAIPKDLPPKSSVCPMLLPVRPGGGDDGDHARSRRLAHWRVGSGRTRVRSILAPCLPLGLGPIPFGCSSSDAPASDWCDPRGADL